MSESLKGNNEQLAQYQTQAKALAGRYQEQRETDMLPISELTDSALKLFVDYMDLTHNSVLWNKKYEEIKADKPYEEARYIGYKGMNAYLLPPPIPKKGTPDVAIYTLLDSRIGHGYHSSLLKLHNMHFFKIIADIVGKENYVTSPISQLAHLIELRQIVADRMFEKAFVLLRTIDPSLTAQKVVNQVASTVKEASEENLLLSYIVGKGDNWGFQKLRGALSHIQEEINRVAEEHFGKGSDKAVQLVASALFLQSSKYVLEGSSDYVKAVVTPLINKNIDEAIAQLVQRLEVQPEAFTRATRQKFFPDYLLKVSKRTPWIKDELKNPDDKASINSYRDLRQFEGFERLDVAYFSEQDRKYYNSMPIYIDGNGHYTLEEYLFRGDTLKVRKGLTRGANELVTTVTIRRDKHIIEVNRYETNSMTRRK